MSDREFLESMAHADDLVEHNDNCGHCGMQIIQTQTAGGLFADGEILDGIAKWVAEHRRRRYASKYFDIYQFETAAGRNPNKAFDEQGWEM